MAILVAGGAGYIGSHTCVELLNAGYDVIVVDNLSNSSAESLKRVERITGRILRFYQADIRDRETLDEIFQNEDIQVVINFAGLKAVGESGRQPLAYYHNNITCVSTRNSAHKQMSAMQQEFARRRRTLYQNLICRKI